MKRIAPSILSADFVRLKEEIQAVEAAGADYIHVDVMDGHFVPNITIGPPVVASVRKVTRLPLDVHLMIENPDQYIPEFAKAGADILSVHQETCPHLNRTVNLIKEHGLIPGVVLNPSTPITTLDDILGEVGMVMIMSVNPGFGGQKFIPRTVHKVMDLKKMIQERGLRIDIEIDGGVTPDNVGELCRAGVEIVVAGSAIFSTPNYKATIDLFRERMGDC
jgi:ribulose-phosphate 3-epimerase